MILFLKFIRAILIVVLILFGIDASEQFTTFHLVNMALFGVGIGVLSYFINKKGKKDLTS